MKDFEQKVLQYLTERGWHKLRPSNLAKSVMIEGAELLEIFQWDNQTLEEVKNDSEKMKHIKKELADVMLYCFDIAVLLELDTEQILNDKLEAVKEKYPLHTFNPDNMPEEPGTEEAYKKVKQEYRQSGNS
jgi:dCTP diphosphatase